MIRFNKAIAAAALLFAMPTGASALGISILNVSSTGASPTYLLNGDIITFDLRLDNPGNVGLFGLGISVSGFDTPGTNAFISSGLQLQAGGLVAANAFSAAFDPDPIETASLLNTRTAPVNVWAINLLNPQAVTTSLFNGADLLARNGDGTQDNGPLGQTGANGIHFRVSYRLLVNNSGNAQNLNLVFGTDAASGALAIGAGGNPVPFANASYALTVIPEPGTALLMGLGLAALASRRR